MALSAGSFYRTDAGSNGGALENAVPGEVDLGGYEPTSRPLWVEAFFPIDWLALHLSPVYYGFGIPHGDGEPVVVVPGFLGDDKYLTELYLWLRRIGYKPYFSGIGRNVDCPEILTQRLCMTIRQAYEDTGKQVTIVGHSLGGMLARGAAHRTSNIVNHVITMGSPFQGVQAHPMVLSVANFVRSNIVGERKRRREVTSKCFTPQCSCEFVATLRDGEPKDDFDRHAIYSTYDGVVDWRVCIEEDEELNHRVSATHIGMAFSPDVYRKLGNLIAGEDEA